MQKNGRNGLSYDAEIEDTNLKHTRGSAEFQTYRHSLTWESLLLHIVSSDLIWDIYSYITDVFKYKKDKL